MFPRTHQIDVQHWDPYKMNGPDIHKQSFTVKNIQYPLSTNIIVFDKMAELENAQKVAIIKGISMHYLWHHPFCSKISPGNI